MQLLSPLFVNKGLNLWSPEPSNLQTYSHENNHETLSDFYCSRNNF
jgi:hypothetical protein